MIQRVRADLQKRGGEIFYQALLGDGLDPSMFATAEDPGFFGPESVAWKIQADLAVLVGGFRSLLLQSLHPLAMAAVADNSVMQDDPLGRFRRTTQFVLITTMGNSKAAQTAIDRVNRIHQAIEGVTSDGVPYQVSDPHLILWVHIAEVESFLTAHNMYGAFPLTKVEQDRYVEEMAIIAVKLGADPELVPTTVEQLQTCLDGFVDECVYGTDAQHSAKFLLQAPMSAIARVPYAAVGAAALDSLPSWAKQMMNIDPKPGVNPLIVDPGIRTVLQGLRWVLAENERERKKNLAQIFG